MSGDFSNPETIVLHGGSYRADPATTAVAVARALLESSPVQWPSALRSASRAARAVCRAALSLAGSRLTAQCRWKVYVFL